VNIDETPESLEARSAMAAAIRRLGNALVGHRVDPDLARRIAAAADALAAEVVEGEERDRLAEVVASHRFGTGSELPHPADIDPDGGAMDLFHDSVVSGRTNPLGIGLRIHRHGDSAVGTVALGPAHEGAPRRAHGGVVAAIFDETMGFALSIAGVVAYTANLSIDFVAPAPVGVEIAVSARIRDRAGRKLWIEATGEGPDGVFARAEGLFLTVDLERFRLEDV
jgi:acyl-coenzyme A thioesterase PaaI-like protein